VARTTVKKYDQPIVVTTEEIRETVQEWLERCRGDEDKSGEMENMCYWQGSADALENILMLMTGQKPEEESTG
jgi:hypothetical protein